MKSLQLLVLVLAAGLTQVYAQQEVDPDHFDQPASQTAVQKANVSRLHSQHRPQRSHQMLASKHAPKGHHHHSRTA